MAFYAEFNTVNGAMPPKLTLNLKGILYRLLTTVLVKRRLPTFHARVITMRGLVKEGSA